MRPLQFLALAACGMALGAMAAIACGTSLWKRTTRRALATLCGQDADKVASSTFSLEQIAALPAPVARYFRFALTPGQLLLRGARRRDSLTRKIPCGGGVAADGTLAERIPDVDADR